MEQRNDDLSNDEGLPAPGTDEPDSRGDGGSAEEGPGNVSVDEPTAGALEGNAGTPGGADPEDSGEGEDDDSGADDSDNDDDSSDEDSSDDEEDEPSDEDDGSEAG